MSTIKGLQALCKRCLKWHNLEYQNQINGTQHLVYRCPFRKLKLRERAVEYLPYKPDLPINSYNTKTFENRINQENFLD